MVVPIYSRTHPTLAGVTSHVMGHQSRGRFFDRHRVLRFRVGQHPTAPWWRGATAFRLFSAVHPCFFDGAESPSSSLLAPLLEMPSGLVTTIEFCQSALNLVNKDRFRCSWNLTQGRL